MRPPPPIRKKASSERAAGQADVAQRHELPLQDRRARIHIHGDGVWQRATATVDGRTVEVAGTGGWAAPGVLEARLVPLHSPHVLDVTADVNAGTATLEWQLTPLGNVSLARRAF